MSAYTEAVAEIVGTVPAIRDLTGCTGVEAVMGAALTAVATAEAARKRIGKFRYETTSDEIERLGFLGAVAADILDGTVSRPSTGNVREYALSLL